MDRSVAALLEDVARLSRRFGLDPEFARGGGGNSSAKAGGILYIKPSGLSLAALSAEALMPLRMEPLLALLHGDGDAAAAPGTDEIMRVALAARVDVDDPRRPSVECLFHALLPERIVLHTHPTVVNALTCARDGRRLAAELFGDDVLWVPYVDPGLPLARRIAAERRAHEERMGRPAPRAMLLQNHGLIVTGERTDDVVAQSELVVEAIRRRVGVAAPDARRSPEFAPAGEAEATVRVLAPALRWLLGGGGHPRIVTFDDSPAAVEIAGTPWGRELVLGGPLTPDQIVYAGSWPLWLEPSPVDDVAVAVEALRGRLAEHLATTGEAPSLVIAAGLGLFAAADTARFAATAREVFLDAMRIALGARRLGGVRVMAPGERRFIEEWEAEAYRRGIEAGTSGSAAARGLVALVTGASRDPGEALASGLAEAGAHVVLADTDGARVEAGARALDDRFGVGRALALVLDSPEEESASAAVRAAVRRFGGLDLAIRVEAAGSGGAAGPRVRSRPQAEAAAVFAVQRLAGSTRWGAVVDVSTDEVVRHRPDGSEVLARRRRGRSWTGDAVRAVRRLVETAGGSEG